MNIGLRVCLPFLVECKGLALLSGPIQQDPRVQIVRSQTVGEAPWVFGVVFVASPPPPPVSNEGLVGANEQCVGAPDGALQNNSHSVCRGSAT